MAHRPATLLGQRALDRKAGIVEVQERIHRAHLIDGLKVLGISAVQDHRRCRAG